MIRRRYRNRARERGQTATEYVIVFAVLVLLMLMTLDAYIYPALVQGQNGLNTNFEQEVNKGYGARGGEGDR